MRESIIDFYLEYINEFLTIDKMAEYYNISTDEMQIIIDAGRKLHEIESIR